ncbi:MAG TPA: LysE family transporter [Rhabdochlamydiaceae bacterium]|jgi:threonine/homoserine/homoserine lactone efflux protein
MIFFLKGLILGFSIAAPVGPIGTDFISTFFLTITNPMTILSFLAVFAGLGLSTTGSYADSIILVLGIFFGSAFWWLLLSEGVTFFRKKMSQKVMVWINRFAGLIIIGFGIASLVSIL